MVFYPLAIPLYLGGVRNLMFIELISPVLCFIFFMELLSEKRPLFSRKISIFFIAIAVLSLWAMLHYLKNPVSGQMLFGASYQEGGIRAYYIIFVGITTFLCSFWFFRYKKLNVNKWFILLLTVSLFLGYLRLIGYFNGFDIPFVGGVFRYAGATKDFYRIGGLSEMAILGITVFLSLYYRKKLNIFPIAIFIAFFVLLILSGGRSAFFGTILTIFVYFTLINKKYFYPFILFFLIVTGIYTIFLSGFDLHYQAKRLIAVEGGFEEQDKFRYSSFQNYLDAFKDSPVFGKGIGHKDIKTLSVESRFAEIQLATGGHGSYLSILSIFGIGGLFFLIVMLFGSMYYAYKIFKNETDFKDNAKLALFAFLYLIILSVVFIPGHAGYNNIELWFLSGLIAGLTARDEVENGKFQ